MRISGPHATALAREAPGARRAGPAGFSLGEGANAATRVASGNLRAISGIDALVALQGLEEPAERRRRAVRSGRRGLDALEALKVGLLSGRLDQADLNRLRAAAAEMAERTDEPGLDQVLSAIDLRLQVEIAKLSRR